MWHLEAIALVLRATGGVRVGLVRYTWTDAPPPFLVMLVPVVALTVAMAALSYYLVERRFLRMKQRRTRAEEPPSVPPLLPSATP